MKQKIVLFIVMIALVVSCFSAVALADTTYSSEQGDIVENPWGDEFRESNKPLGTGSWEFGPDIKQTNKKQTASTTEKAGNSVKTPGKAVIKKIYKKKYASKKIKLVLKKDSRAAAYQVAVFKTKKNAKKLVKAIYVKSFNKTKITLKSKKFKKKKKLYVRVRAYNYPKIGAWSKVKKVKIKKK